MTEEYAKGTWIKVYSRMVAKGSTHNSARLVANDVVLKQLGITRAFAVSRRQQATE